MARSSFGLSKGVCRWFSASIPITPTRSFTATFTPREPRSMGSRSNCGTCTQSTSPFCRAEEAVALSGMTRHSTRSKCTTLPPAR